MHRTYAPKFQTYIYMYTKVEIIKFFNNSPEASLKLQVAWKIQVPFPMWTNEHTFGLLKHNNYVYVGEIYGGDVPNVIGVQNLPNYAAG